MEEEQRAQAEYDEYMYYQVQREQEEYNRRMDDYYY